MKILAHAITCRAAGALTVALNFFRSYAEGDFPHEMVVYGPTGVGYEDLPKNGLRLELAPKVVHKGLARPWVDNVWTRGILEREKPDLLFSMGSIAYPTRVPQVVLYHWPYAIYPEREIWSRMTPVDRANRGIRRWLFSRRSRYATRFAAQTETARARLEKLWGLDNVSVVPNAVSLPAEHFGGELGPAAKRAAAAIPEGQRGLLCLTRYYPHKNLDVLLRVCRRIRDEKLPFVVFTTVSPGDDRSAGGWIESIRSEGLEEVLVNLGTVPMQEVPGLYAVTAGLLLPTLMESFSGTYVESMFYRRPIFTSDRDFARDVCGDVAWYFDPHDADDIVATLRSAFDDASAMEARVSAAREHCDGFATWPEVTRRYVEVFEQAARERGVAVA